MNEDMLTTESLNSENYANERNLNSQNRKILQKAFKYIRRFPIEEKNIEIIRKDLIGMAQEAESQNRTLEDKIEGNIKDFCNKLIEANTGHKIPPGRNLLYGVGTFYLAYGIISLLIGFYMYSAIFVYVIGQIDAGQSISLAPIGFDAGSLIIMGIRVAQDIKAGLIARKYSGDSRHAKKCFGWGIGLILVNILVCCLSLRVTENAMETIVLTIVQLIPAILYVGGARQNLAADETCD